MLLIIETILTIVAWRKGWRGMALLPMGIGIVVATMIGFMAGAAGVAPEQSGQLQLALLPLDFLAIGVLIWMVAKGRKSVPRVPETKTFETPPAITQPV